LIEQLDRKCFTSIEDFDPDQPSIAIQIQHDPSRGTSRFRDRDLANRLPDPALAI
jgi:hypothetical protein